VDEQVIFSLFAERVDHSSNAVGPSSGSSENSERSHELAANLSEVEGRTLGREGKKRTGEKGEQCRDHLE
jgi:hypothetical protein